MNPYVWVNEKYDWMQRNNKVLWVELLVYASFGSVVVCAYKSLLPESWLCVLFFSVMGFWVAFSLVRLSWLFVLRRRNLNAPFEG